MSGWARDKSRRTSKRRGFGLGARVRSRMRQVRAIAVPHRQRLREHLGYLRQNAAAEQLGTKLDRALHEQVSVTQVLERFLELRVEDTKSSHRRGRLRYAR